MATASYILTQFMNKQLLVCKSEKFPGHSFLFHKKSSRKDVAYFECRRCREIRGNLFGRVSVINGLVNGDPDTGHHPDCLPLSDSDVAALSINRGMRREARRGAKRPRELYVDAVADIPCKFPRTDQQASVQSPIPAYYQIQRQLYRHAEHSVVPLPDPLKIPTELQLTIRGENAPSNDPHHGEIFLFFEHSDPRILLFASKSELLALHNSSVWVCDGTFLFCPKDFSQLYSIHGFINGEALPLVYALLPNKTKNVYQLMFGALLNELIYHFGGPPSVESMIFDYEIAAQNAAKHYFPSAVIHGCMFHYSQAIVRKLQCEGLRSLYANDGPFKQWMKCILAMPMLPPELIRPIWVEFMLPNVPRLIDELEQQKIKKFVSYWEGQWLTMNPSDWTHFHNPGPRTTNHAEGWHNSLHYSFGRTHPTLRWFLHFLRKLQVMSQTRIIQLNSGQPPKPKNQVYKRVNEQILRAKAVFWERLNNNMEAGEIVYECVMYLLHMSNLIGA